MLPRVSRNASDAVKQARPLVGLVLICCRYKEEVAKSQDSIRGVLVVRRAAYDAVDAVNQG